ncbi:MAG: sporulation protein YtfJ [Clostridiaceae bacterium]|nr:sporulation protein YtfJ [Clostridiaceae bacterium]
MGQHPIEELMKTAMESIKEMVDVNTIVGDAVQTIDGTVIIPVSKVWFGFAAGGGEFSKDNKSENSAYPFAGGSGAGVSINPVAFLIVGRNNVVRMIPAAPHATLDRALDSIPSIMEQIKKLCKKDDKSSNDDALDKDKEKVEYKEKIVDKTTIKYKNEEDNK